MADSFDIMAVRIGYKGCIIIGMIMFPQTGLAVVSPACSECRFIKAIYLRAGSCRESDMKNAFQL